MNRRRFLAALAVGATGVGAGCTGTPGNPASTPTRTPTPSRTPTPTDTPVSTPAECENLQLHPVALDEYTFSGYSDGLELTASRPTVPFGDEITIRLRNTSNQTQLTGNHQLYALQKATADGWEHVLSVPPNFAWTEEAIEHEPSEGFTWTFPFSMAGLSRDSYTVCSPLDPGTYRFVYWGLMTQRRALAVQFTAGLETEILPVENYEAYVFDHAGIDSPVVEGGIHYDSASSTHRHYVTLLSSAGDAERFDEALLRQVDSGAAEFVSTTDFETASLLVFQEFPMSSSPNYSVERVERLTDDVHVFVDDSSQGGTDDITVETVLVRIPYSGEGRPRFATVTTEEDVTYSTVD